MLPGYQTYQNEMILAGHGFPMWYGDPYGGKEIQIGDVGYMDEGAFQFIRRLDRRYTTRERRIDFPIPLLSGRLEERGIRAAGGVETPALPANAVGQISLSTSRRAFAVLNVEQGHANFISCSDGDEYAMGQMFLRNAQSWLKDAVTEGIVGAEFPVGRLILVTGFYKTWNWAAMTMSSESSEGGLGFSVTATGLGGGGLSYDWNDVQQVTPHRSSGHHHPESVPPATVTALSTNQLFAGCCRGHHNVRNQCIFLRGFRYRERVILRDGLEVLAPPVDWRPSFFRNIFKRFFTRTPNPTGTPTSGPPVPPNVASGESAPQQQSLSAHVEPIDGLPDTDTCDQLYDAVALEKFMDKNLSAVVVHDDELIALLERDQLLQDSRLVYLTIANQQLLSLLQ